LLKCPLGGSTLLELNQVLKKSPLLAPENPNKATAIVGGLASGILNWNDVMIAFHLADIKSY
jgi:hypothetical protein